MGAVKKTDPRVPPTGIAISAEARAALEAGAAELGSEIEKLRGELKDKPELLRLLPDVEIYHKAVDWAVRYEEFYRSNEVELAKTLLKQGMERVKALSGGEAPWLSATGLVVRGYRSRIDGSVQPYGLVVPPGAQGKAGNWIGVRGNRLDVWLHGRDDTLTELKFIGERQRSPGEFTPQDTIVLHPYGRYCNAFKFAGETDVFEAIAHVRSNNLIDSERIAIRGFSMGGAGTWHLAAHHAGFWTAAAPGAGFAETAMYTKVLAKEPYPPVYEQRLWHLYDATDYAANLFNCGLIAYSGELDPQKQAADMMAKALKVEGLEMRHLIGPKVQHKYEPETKKELAKEFDVLMVIGKEMLPKKVRLTTFTTRYNKQEWVTVDAMEKQWARARVEAEVVDGNTMQVKTENVAGLTLATEGNPVGSEGKVAVRLDGQTIEVSSSSGDGWVSHFVKTGKTWKVGEVAGVHKKHALQGPIDDAFYDSFIMVRPTGKPMSAESGKWVEKEFERATNAWRGQFRGYARVKNDTEITEEDMRESHLVLWGDAQSNQLLRRMAGKLPVQWAGGEFKLRGKTYSTSRAAPVLIFPNPLNPEKYVVLNSGFTFSEFGKASNAQQTPKLPDWAVVDITVPLAERLHAGIRAAGFFNEKWE
ncbi:MAG: hypothetical protein JWM16_4360 [Verrucomicrobiales bacterium]|nr:hypothetical protein [Verrucomicrobiales bacterium]